MLEAQKHFAGHAAVAKGAIEPLERKHSDERRQDIGRRRSVCIADTRHQVLDGFGAHELVLKHRCILRCRDPARQTIERDVVPILVG